MKIKTRLLALLLALTLSLSLLPLAVLAEDGTEEPVLLPTEEPVTEALPATEAEPAIEAEPAAEAEPTVEEEPVSLTEEVTLAAPASRTAVAYYIDGYYVFDAQAALGEDEYAAAFFDERTCWPITNVVGEGEGIIAAYSTEVYYFLPEGNTWSACTLQLIPADLTFGLTREYLLAEQGREYPVPVSAPASSLPDFITVSYRTISPEYFSSADYYNPDYYYDPDHPDASAMVDAADPDLLADGTLKPLSGGSFLLEVRWSVVDRVGSTDNGIRCTKILRVDVLEPTDPADQITGVSLDRKTAAVSLFSTDFTRVGILPEMPSLLGTLSEQVSAEAPETADCTIVSARFTNEVVSNLFELIPNDDRTLTIYPKEETVAAALANKKSVKSSYSSPIEVKLSVNGEVLTFTTAALTLKVSQNRPTIKTQTISLNSYAGIDSAKVSFPGFAVQNAVITGGFDTEVKTWLSADLSAGELDYIGDAGVRRSTVLKAELTCEGWRVTLPVTLKVNAAPVAPKVTFGKTTVNLISGASDYVVFSYKVASSYYSDPERYPLELESITDNETGEVLENNPQGFYVSIDNINRNIGVTDFGSFRSARSYTVTCTLAGQSFSFRVNTKLPAVKLSLKASGRIDLATDSVDALARTAGSAVMLKPTVSGANKLLGFYPGSFELVSVTETLYQKKTVAGTYDITDLFAISAMDSSGALYLQYNGSFDDIWNRLVRPQDAAAMGCTVKYAVTLRYCYAKENESNPYAYPALYTDPVTVNFNMKFIENQRATATLKITGSMDRLRFSTVTVTPTFKNLSNAWLYGDSGNSNNREDLVFYTKRNGQWVELENWGNWFDYEIEYAGYAQNSAEDYRKEDYTGDDKTTYLGKAYKKYLVTYNTSLPLEGDYAVSLRLKDANGNFVCDSPITQLRITRGKVKVTADRTSLTLLRKDRYDITDSFTLSVTDWSVHDFERIEPDAASQAYFHLIMLDDGSYALTWKDSTLPTDPKAPKAGTVKTVKLLCYINGDTSGKPTATVSLKLTIV